MRLRQIRDFVAVVEAGGIRAAARKLGVSQPAITKSLRGLESELHVQLVQRTPQGVVPTPAGRAFFIRARAADAELRKGEEEAAQGEQGTGSVTFGVGPAAGFLIVPEALMRFRKEFPKARVRIVEAYLPHTLPLVRDESLDFAIGPRHQRRLDRALAFRPLFRHDFIVAARKGHPLRNARTLAQLADAEWIEYIDGPVEQTFAAAGLPVPAHVVQCDSAHTAIGLLMRTDMLRIMSQRELTGPFGQYLQHIAVRESLPSSTAGIFMRSGSPLTPPAAALVKALIVSGRLLARTG